MMGAVPGVDEHEPVECAVRGSVSLGHFSSPLGSAEARFNEFVVLLQDEIACVPFPEKKLLHGRVCFTCLCSQLAARLHTFVSAGFSDMPRNFVRGGGFNKFS